MTAQRWRRLLKSESFVGSVGKLVSASVLGQVILLVSMPVITRLYSPADFGLFAVFTAVFGIVLVASSFRYELAIPLPSGEGNAFALLLLALFLNGLVAVVSAILVAPWGRHLAQALNAPGLETVLWLLPICILGAGSYRAFRFWAVRHHDFGAIARTKITQAIANVVVQISCGLVGLGAAGLAAGHFFGLTAGAYRLAQGAALAFRGFGRGQRRRMFGLARRYARFPKFDVPAALVNAFSTQLPNLLLAVLFNPVIAGYYLLAERVLGTPLGLLSQSVGQVLYAESRQAIANRKMAALAIKVLLGLLAILSLPVLVTFFAGEPLFALIFGEAWRGAGLFASWLVIGLLGQSLYSSISLVLIATNAQNINLLLQLGMLIVKTAALLYGYTQESALSAIVVFALANFLGYIVAMAIVIRHAHNFRVGGAVHPVEIGEA